MSFETRDTTKLSSHHAGVLVVGAGGLSCPALAVLAKSGITRFTLVDDDRVDLSNLHRQTLYEEADIGRLKVDVAAERIGALSPTPRAVSVQRIVDRVTPDNALALFSDCALVLEGADNFATKFLACDAAQLARVPIVQAGAVRFSGWALGTAPGESACLRCIFEDIPRGQPETCAVAGVLGPVVGALGALEAAIAIELLLGRVRAAGVLFSYDALGAGLRRRRVQRRDDCALCQGRVRELSLERYTGACTI